MVINDLTYLVFLLDDQYSHLWYFRCNFFFLKFLTEKSSFEYGLVNHALGQAMESLIKVRLMLVFILCVGVFV